MSVKISPDIRRTCSLSIHRRKFFWKNPSFALVQQFDAAAFTVMRLIASLAAIKFFQA
jgi:hypothetical protein